MANFMASRLYSTSMMHCDPVWHLLKTVQPLGFCRQVSFNNHTKLFRCICRCRSTLSDRHPSSNHHVCHVSPQGITKIPKITSFLLSHGAIKTHKTSFANHFHTSALNLSVNGNNEEQRLGHEKEDTMDANPDGVEEGNISNASNGTDLNQNKLDVIPQNSGVNFVNNFKQSIPDILHDTDEVDILSEQKEVKIVEEFSKPPLMPSSFTLASYVEHSEVLQKLVQLGVDLSKVEKRLGVADRIVKLNFNPQVAEKISFLNFVGVKSDDLGDFLTKNPHILFEEQENLEKRVGYLSSKKFDQAAIAQMVNRAPYLLCFSVERLDKRLGFYQQALQLSGDELRQIVTAFPKLLTWKLMKAKDNMFLINKQLGFTKNEMKQLVISHPRILSRGQHKLISIFDYLHNDMGISHELIMKNYQVFNSRAFLIQERHKFLASLGRAQYDPTKPGYVSLKRLVTVPDDAFCEEIAKVSMEEYNTFLKTL